MLGLLISDSWGTARWLSGKMLVEEETGQQLHPFLLELGDRRVVLSFG